MSAFCNKMFSAESPFRRIFATRMEKSDRQKRARAFASEFLELLISHEADQEAKVRRMVDERWAELKPKIEALIDERIKAANQRN